MNVATQQWILIVAVFMAGCAAQPSVPAEQVVADAATESSATPADESKSEAEQVAQKPDTEVVIEVNPDVVCKYEKRTGTNVVERRCYTTKQLEEMEARSKDALRSQGQQGAFYEPLHKKDPRNRPTDPD